MKKFLFLASILFALAALLAATAPRAQAQVGSLCDKVIVTLENYGKGWEVEVYNGTEHLFNTGYLKVTAESGETVFTVVELAAGESRSFLYVPSNNYFTPSAFFEGNIGMYACHTEPVEGRWFLQSYLPMILR